MKDGNTTIESMKDMYNQDVKSYNESKTLAGKGLIFRATDTKRGKKKYFYWYRAIWDPVKKKTVHKYIGKYKPEANIPNPPEDPLKHLKKKDLITIGNDLIILEAQFEKHRKLFSRNRTKKIKDVPDLIEEIA